MNGFRAKRSSRLTVKCVSEMQVRILHTESPRIPGEGSSALGKSGPNARPKGVVDGKQADIPVPVWRAME